MVRSQVSASYQGPQFEARPIAVKLYLGRSHLNLYLDSSALVKVFVNEEGRSLLLENIAGADSLTSSRIAYVECRAAISRAERDSRLNSKEAAGAVENLNHRWPELQVVELDGHLTKQAGDLTRTQRLRAGDAIHLASAAVLVEKDTSEVTFACWDIRLWGAAEGLGYVMLPSTIPEQ